MILQVCILLLSIFFLYLGAELALDSSEKIGKVLGLPNLLVGLLLVGLGTSLPEFFVSHLAALKGVPEMALGNIIGSNIGNLLMILGLTGLLVNVNLAGKNIKNQLILHLVLTVGLGIILSFDELYPLSGLALFTFFLYYLFFSYIQLRRKNDHRTAEEIEEVKHILESNFEKIKLFAKLMLGFTILYLGGELLVRSGTKICEHFGISEYVISAIFVAFGTSFPELVTSLLACYKRKDLDLIVGNVIGSNIFNVAFVLGTLGFYKINFQRSFMVESTVLVGVAIYLIILNLMNKSFYRFSGALFFLGYLGVVYYWIQ